MQWLAENIGSIILCAAVVALVAGLVISLVKKKKQGKTTCGCGCEHCAMSGSCHSKKTDSDKN